MGFKIKLNGEIKAEDDNDDGEIDDDEINDQGIQDIMEPTEMGEVMKELNKDDLESGTRQSSIDLRARLHYIEHSNLLAVDSLVGFNFLPQSCLALSRQKKRLSVSLDGMGRKEIVQIATGNPGKEDGERFWDRMKKGLFGGKKKDEEEQ
jgi:hypothetical protein